MKAGPKIRCKSCGEVIQSTHVHDFVTCSCFRNEVGNRGCAIDGGSEYTRILGNPGDFEKVEDQTEDARDQ